MILVRPLRMTFFGVPGQGSGRRDPASPDSVQDELASTVQNALEPTFLSVWLRLEQEGTR